MCSDRKWPRRRTVALAAALAAELLGMNACHSGTPPAMADAPEHFYLSPAPDHAPGEYIVTLVPGTGPDWLRRHYGEYGVREVVDLGGDMFLMKLDHDPGQEAIERTGTESGKVKAVQPNFTYHGTP